MAIRQRILTLILGSTLAVVSFAARSGTAEANDGCDVAPGSNVLDCRKVDQKQPSTGTIGTNGQGKPMYRWERTNLGGGDDFAVTPNCPSRTEGGAPGVLFEIKMYSIASGEMVWSGMQCVFLGDSVPQPPPPPPTVPEILSVGDSKELMTIEPQIMPPPKGTPVNGGVSFGALVNRSMWAWCNEPEPVEIELELRGWQVEAKMEAVAMKWSVNGTGGAKTTLGDTACGSKPKLGSNGNGAPWSWTPKRKGNYTVSLTAVWTGEATLSYLGDPVSTEWLGEHEYTDSVDQTVLEMQALNR